MPLAVPECFDLLSWIGSVDLNLWHALAATTIDHSVAATCSLELDGMSHASVPGVEDFDLHIDFSSMSQDLAAVTGASMI